MKDIGSIFPIYQDPEHLIYDDEKIELPILKKGEFIQFYSLCREAIFDIASQFKDVYSVLLPAYTCQTVIDPFKQLDYKIFYYQIRDNLRIDTEDFLKQLFEHKPGIVLAHPYYGVDLNENEMDALKQAKADGVCTILDLTQCIFSDVYDECIDYYVGSIRKWLAVPDGAFLLCKNKYALSKTVQDENKDFIKLQIKSMRLRGKYFETGNEVLKQQSREIQSEVDRLTANKIVPYKISDYSTDVLLRTDFEELIQKRRNNYLYLYNNLLKGQSGGLYSFVDKELNLTTAPLYFPIYVNDRKMLQNRLAKAHIYAPVLWPVEDEEVLDNPLAMRIYERFLAIPCDQRYDENDMKKIVYEILGGVEE